jgi:long-chain acyl-CoA synthetase
MGEGRAATTTGVGDERPRIPGFWDYAPQDRSRTAIEHRDGSVTFGALSEKVNQCGNALLERCGTNTTVAILARNQLDYLVLVLACQQSGHQFTPINSHFSAPEVAYVLRDSGSVALFAGAEMLDCARAAADLSGFDHGRVVRFGPDRGWLSFDEWMAPYPTTTPTFRAAGRPMLYTSGTSGRPKGVRLLSALQSPEDALARFTSLLSMFGIDPTAHVGAGVHLVTSPLYHTAPLNFALTALHMGHAVVVMDRFDAADSLHLIGRHAVTWTHMVPTMMKRWLDLAPERRADIDVRSLQWVIHGAAPCPPTVKRAMLDWLGPVLYEYYASTEVGGTAIGPDDWLEHPGSVGRPWPGAAIQILDDSGHALASNTVGHVYMREARPFEYHNDPDKTSEAHREDWVTVGDLGFLDDDGYLYIADRRTDLILSGGANVYPAEIEAVLLAHPDVADAGVIGVPHPDLHQVPHAVVEPRRGADEARLTDRLLLHCEENLQPASRPHSIEFGEVPRSAAGKVLRRELKEAWRTRTASGVSAADHDRSGTP